MNGPAVTDALIITALREELDALLAVEAGRVEPWIEEPGDPPVRSAIFETETGPLRLVAVHLTKMGATMTAQIGEQLISRFRPRSLAMCGVCAGHPKDTDLGDVVVGERVFQYDEGKLRADGPRADIDSYRMMEPWLRAAGSLVGPARGLPGYADATIELGERWLLEQLLAGRDPLQSGALQRYVPKEQRPELLTRLRNEKLITFKGRRLALRAKGRKTIEEYLLLHGSLTATRPYHVHLAPIGSGMAVVSDPSIWSRIEVSERKILAVEMEAAAVGQVAHRHTLPFAVIKGVMDHADAHKADDVKAFAARASAEVLCTLLRKVLARTSERVALRLPVPDTNGEEIDPGASQELSSEDRDQRDESRREATLKHLIELLRGKTAVMRRLGQAHEPWSVPAGIGADALAQAILCSREVPLASAFLAAMRDVPPKVSRAEAEILIEVFEHALPCVATSSSELSQDADGRWVTRVRLPQTLEPHMAWSTTSSPRKPRIEMAEPEHNGADPVPKYYIEVQHLPETGAVSGERVDVVEQDVEDRFLDVPAIGRQWFPRSGGLERFNRAPDFEKASVLEQDVRALGERPLYGLIREPNEAALRYIDDLQTRVRMLRVVVGKPAPANVDEDYRLASLIRLLYEQFEAASADARTP